MAWQRASMIPQVLNDKLGALRQLTFDIPIADRRGAGRVKMEILEN